MSWFRTSCRDLRAFGLCAALAVSACGPAQTGIATLGSREADATQLRVAAAAMAAGRPETALPLLDEHLRHHTDDAHALLQRGQALAALGRSGDAAQDFARVAAADPRRLEALAGLARARLAQGRAPAAEAAWRQALALRPDDAQLQTGLAIALDLQDKHGEAQAIYQVLLSRDPDNTAARANLGLSLALSGRVNDALPLLRDAANSGSQSRTSMAEARVWHNLAVGLALAGHEKEARTVLSRDLSPSAVDAAMAGLRQFASIR